MATEFLKHSYGKSDPQTVRDHYDAWAASYDAEIQENGYATPGRCAAALAEFVTDKRAPILDFGCGTGLSGLALRLSGFEVIDGLDLSADMLKGAQASGAYRALDVIELGAPLPQPNGAYTNFAAIGVIGAGAAPLGVFHMLMDALPQQGKLVFSFNDHALAESSNEAAIVDWVDRGAAQVLFKEYGDHLPGINLKSNVYVIAKL